MFFSSFLQGFTAAAPAKSLQSCLTLCNPTDGSPPGSFVHRTPQVRILEWVAISFSSVRYISILFGELSLVAQGILQRVNFLGDSVHHPPDD